MLFYSLRGVLIMANSIIPNNFQQWKHCITVECGLTLTASFIEQRIRALQTDSDHHTKQFTRLYGEQYRQQVIYWFQQAQREL